MRIVEYLEKKFPVESKRFAKKHNKASRFLKGKLSLEEKQSLYKKLGAVKFQKLVFKVENVKFKVIKKFFPNYINKIDKFLDNRRKKELANANSQEEINKINEKYKTTKLELRRELNQNKNKNYHLDHLNHINLIKYLKWNKNVHKNKLKKNLIILPILLVGTFFGYIPVAVLLVLNITKIFIDFQCINIQNYNICRYEQRKEKLEKIEERKLKSDYQKYGEGAEVISKANQNSETLPSIDKIFDLIENKEQLEAIKKLIEKEQLSRTMAMSIIKKGSFSK